MTKERDRKNQYIHSLKEFEIDFASGKIDHKYEEMLARFIDTYDGAVHDSKAKEEFIKNATRNIKDKLFSFYVNEYKRSSHYPKSHKDNIEERESSGDIQFKSLENRSSKKTKHVRMMSQDFLKHQPEQKAATREMPYLLKSPTRFKRLYAQSIHQAYMNQLENIDYATKVNQKKRKIQEQIFLTKLK